MSNLNSRQQFLAEEREQLLGPWSPESPFSNNATKRKLHNAESARRVATDTTSSLAKSQNLLLNTVNKSALTLEQLGQSSAKVVDTRDELTEQSSTIATSRSLLAKYGRRELTDRLLILLALMMFLGVVLYIVRKRF